MCKINNCCCCFSVSTGTKIIGALLVLDLLGEFNHPTVNMGRWALKIALVGVFAAMILRDTKFNRMLFFFAYIANFFLQGVVNNVTDDSDDPEAEKAWANFDVKKIAKDTCEKMSVQDRQSMHYANVDECTKGMEGIIWRSVIMIGLVFAVLAISIAVHFTLVLYSHWQNADKSVEDGGTGESRTELKDEL